MIKRISFIIALLGSVLVYSQAAVKVNNAQNVPTSVANPPFFLGADPVPEGTIRKYIVSDIRFNTNQITGLDTFIQSTGNSLWQPLLGYVPVTNMRTLSINGISYDLSANRVWNIDFNSLIDKPTSLSGYGINDAYPLIGNPSGFLTSVPAQTWASITGKPTFALVATTGDYNDLVNKPTIPSSQVNTDWNSVSGVSQLLNKPTNVSAFINDSSYATTTALTSGLSTKEGVITAGTVSQYYRGDKTMQTLNTSVVPESGNLYYTDVRARTSNSAGTGISYNSGTGVITNSAPDQTVSFTTTGSTTVTGTYPSFTVTSPTVKRMESYSGVTNSSGVYTITYGVAYSVTPNVQFQVNGGTNKTTILLTSSTATGCSFLVQVRNDVLGLLPTYSNVNGANVDVLVIEK